MQLYNLKKGKLTKPSSSPKGPHIRLHCQHAFISWKPVSFANTSVQLKFREMIPFTQSPFNCTEVFVFVRGFPFVLNCASVVFPLLFSSLDFDDFFYLSCLTSLVFISKFCFVRLFLFFVFFSLIYLIFLLFFFLTIILFNYFHIIIIFISQTDSAQHIYREVTNKWTD